MLYYLVFVTLFGMYRILITEYGVPRTLDEDIRRELRYISIWKEILLNPFQLVFLIIVGFLNGSAWLIIPVQFLVLRTNFWSKEFFLGKDNLSAMTFVRANINLLSYKHIMKLAEIHEFDEFEIDEIEELFSKLRDSKEVKQPSQKYYRKINK